MTESKEFFNTLTFAKEAEVAGFTKPESEFLAKGLATVLNTVATKKDLDEFKIATEKDLKESEERIIDKMTIKFGAMLFLGLGLVVAILKLT